MGNIDYRPSLEELQQSFIEVEKQSKEYDISKPRLSFKEVSEKYTPIFNKIWNKEDLDEFENEKDAMSILLDMALYSLRKKKYDKAIEYLEYMKNGGYKVKH